MDRPPDDHHPDDRPKPGDDVDEFDAIVSGWRREGPVPAWPSDLPDDVDTAADEPSTDAPAVPDAPTDARVNLTGDVVGDVAAAPSTADEGHFVPPEPPPLPPIGPPAAVGLVLLVLGIVLVSAPGLLGLSDVHGLPLGLLTLAAALGWLVLRLWPTASGPDDHDDGAVL